MKEQFTNYIQNLAISNSFKSIIIDENFINCNPVFYQNYPSLFANIFTLQEQDLDLLNIAGYLYYQATIFTDNLLDENDVSKFPIISICQEESIKILTSIFGLKNDFWVL